MIGIQYTLITIVILLFIWALIEIYMTRNQPTNKPLKSNNIENSNMASSIRKEAELHKVIRDKDREIKELRDALGHSVEMLEDISKALGNTESDVRLDFSEYVPSVLGIIYTSRNKDRITSMCLEVLMRIKSVTDENKAYIALRENEILSKDQLEKLLHNLLIKYRKDNDIKFKSITLEVTDDALVITPGVYGRHTMHYKGRTVIKELKM